VSNNWKSILYLKNTFEKYFVFCCLSQSIWEKVFEILFWKVLYYVSFEIHFKSILYNTGRRPLSVWIQGSVHHTDRQESRPGYQWRQFKSTDHELASCIKAFEVHRCLPTDGLFIVRRPTSYVALFPVIRHQTTSSKSCRGSYQPSIGSELGALVLLDLTTAFDTAITTLCCSACSRSSVSTATRIGGFGRISSVGRSTFVAVFSYHSSPVCCTVCRRDPFWNRCWSFCTPSTSSSRLKDTYGTTSVCWWHSGQRLVPSFQRQRVFVVDLRLPEKRCDLDEVEQASVMWCLDGWIVQRTVRLIRHVNVACNK